MVILVVEEGCEGLGVSVEVDEEGEVVETFETTDDTVERSTAIRVSLVLVCYFGHLTFVIEGIQVWLLC